MINDRLNISIGLANVLVIGVALLLLAACRQHTFERVSASHSGLTFNNKITENDSINVLDFEYIYNGAGVGVGDFNNDGLQDIFFSGNQVPSRIYLNAGNLQFQDVTKWSGISSSHWATGVALVDVNQDGMLDIYQCTIHPDREKSAPNLLYLNLGEDSEGHVKFRDVAAQVGLADKGYSTQAVFFDYDKDGDLDAYILTNALEYYDRNLPKGQASNGTGRSTDRLYRNVGLAADGLPRFKDVSDECGITTEGWGLGIAVSDINQDGWPDIYCANDFTSNDLLWINEHGRFVNRIDQFMMHQSSNSMGADIADINNDGYPEVMTLDMMPEDNLRQKMMFSKQNYERYELNLQKGYQPQFVRNMLQLNNGPDANGKISFSEIGQLAGVHATDWSWSALLADFDNDGFRDLFVTNGYPKDVTNLDFINYNPQSSFSFRPEDAESKRARLEKMQQLIGVHKSNVMFRNKGNLTFEDVSQSWGLSNPSYSNGAAYADFDNDGDLDIVTNNINSEAFLFKNTTVDGKTPGARKNFLRLKLEGALGNRAAYGARVELRYNGKLQVAELSPYRGYKSTVETILHFGLDTLQQVDTVVVKWLYDEVTIITNIKANQVISIKQDETKFTTVSMPEKNLERALPIFKDVSEVLNVPFEHQENDYIDFKVQVLAPYMHSRLGPSLAAADVDGNGLDDFFVGTPSGSSEVMYLQMSPGAFQAQPFVKKPSPFIEDGGVLFVDLDGDGDQDLYIASGGNESPSHSSLLQDRLYINDGAGHFTLSSSLPATKGSASCVNACDFDRDGDLDLFVGGRINPQQYPMPGDSYLLRNDGGRLSDVTDEVVPGLRNIGMVTSALWTDFNNDQWTDLIIVGEFMPVTVFQNKGGQLVDVTRATSLSNTEGWWNSIDGGDFDRDGDVDYILGNFGLNSRLKASSHEPLCVFAKDYDKNGAIDPVMCSYIQGRNFPVHPRDQLIEQVPAFKKKFTSFAQYGGKTFDQVLSEQERNGAYAAKAVEFASSFLENKGAGQFELKTLPVAAQVAPVYGVNVDDYNADGFLDAFLVGNLFSTDVQMGRYDACKGVLLLGDGRGHFIAAKPAVSGLRIESDAKSLIAVQGGEHIYHVTGSNRGQLKVYTSNQAMTSIKAEDNEIYADVIFLDGKLSRVEFYRGSGYLSQSSRFVTLSKNISEIVFYSPTGMTRRVKGRAGKTL